MVKLSSKASISHASLIESLVEHHYHRAKICTIPGEFCVRGDIIDVFPINQTHPIRVEYFGDDIDRLTSFDSQTQRSISTLTNTSIAPINPESLHHYTLANSNPTDLTLLSHYQDGDYVVHEDHGIGQFCGLTRLTLSSIEGEYALIKYAGKDKLYIPLDQLTRITKYTKDADTPPKLHTLHTKTWRNATTKVRKALAELTQEIYENTKKRQETPGFSFSQDSLYQIELEQEFEHTPTKDQATCIEHIRQDMEDTKPMDRLICGDVGYGKTELLIRAACKACDNMKQVAILVPTTLLAKQHLKTFNKRFKNAPYRVEVLSRLTSKTHQKQILSDLKTGKIDILIGTHRLIQADIKFHDLGLLIIDEEQRFGVSHKEKIKSRYPHVDYLSVSATPIPRTLYMSLTGGRAISTIETPPIGRKPILTTLDTYHDDKIKAAIQQEFDRDGQVFYIHNIISTIERKVAHLSTLFPSARIAFMHGQMPAAMLETLMSDFIAKKFDILVSTTIVENGIDIPNANTLIIDNAQRFGLSQIHQLRGRVGRAAKQAYAYLFHDEHLSDTAKQRLDAIKEYTSLGSGYQLALKDLEIRGAGTLLGEKQHGHMTSIGFELYCKLLREAVATYQGTSTHTFTPTFTAYIPENYIPYERERLAIYQRLHAITSIDDIDAIHDELRDRYGPIPKIVTTLLSSLEDQWLNATKPML